ncbi:MAG: PilZ domain-containing protein [Myxococcales bacterium]|nr:PilZ domain-containing protein [Myxococcales bacterium]
MRPDRRAIPRTPARLHVTVGGEPALTADVTANGLCLETTRLAQPGASLSGSIEIRGRTFPFTGMVCWARAERMGVRFIEVPRELKDELG